MVCGFGWRFSGRTERRDGRGELVGVNRYSLRPNRIRSGSKSHCSRDKKGCGFSARRRAEEGKGVSSACFCRSFFSPLARPVARSLARSHARSALILATWQSHNGRLERADCQKVTPMSQLMRSRTLAGQLSEVEGEAEACLAHKCTTPSHPVQCQLGSVSGWTRVRVIPTLYRVGNRSWTDADDLYSILFLTWKRNV